jgi:putative inorganic carbon (HCO3(-)) transporter
VLITGTFFTAFITETYIILAIPVALLTLSYSLIDFRKILFLLIFLIPLSTELRLGDLNLNISLPAEPIIGLLAIIALATLFLKSKEVAIFRHPITIVVIALYLSMIFSGLFSTMPAITAKILLVKTSYMLVFFFLLSYVIRQKPDNIKLIWMLYGLSLIGVILYATFRHTGYGFDKSVSMVMPTPFFADHTIYGTCIGFMLPAFIAMMIWGRKVETPALLRFFLPVFIVIMFAGVFLSYSRAVWVSLLAAGLFYLLLTWGLKFWHLITVMSLAIVFLFIFNEELLPLLRKNNNDSKDLRANLEQQIKSVTNINNDVSNVERLNRWICAIRMFKEKPWSGYGPGTYQFQYIPFQKEKETTVISILHYSPNPELGTGGTAHSEYLLILSESGIFSFLLYITLILVGLHTGIKIFHHASSEKIKYLAAGTMLGLITYTVHGVFNNYLDSSKAALLFWGSLSILATLDTFYMEKHKGSAVQASNI